MLRLRPGVRLSIPAVEFPPGPPVGTQPLCVYKPPIKQSEACPSWTEISTPRANASVAMLQPAFLGADLALPARRYSFAARDREARCASMSTNSVAQAKVAEK